MIGKKINQLATELAPVSTDLTIIGDPISGVSKKITLAQLGAIFSGAVSFYTNLAGFPATGDINVIYCAKDTQKLYLWSGSAYVEVFPSQALLDTYQLRSEKGVSNGYASLDSSGKVPISQLPSSIMEYKGTWNAATNTPTLANGTGDTGDVYICNVAGTVNFGAGPITFAVGDYVIYSGSIWQRSSGAVGTVTSVAASITGNSIGITGSPVTTSGTLAFAFAGTGAQYIKGDGTLATFPNTISQAEKLITEVYNSTGATLTKGTIVYINGGQGNLPTVTKALATGDSTSAQTFGVVQADITNNNNGYVVVAGKLSDLDTQAYTEGTQLYLSATTAGTWTSTKQYAPNHLVYVGIVVRSHPTQGIVEIKIQNGYELDEIHNVAAQTPTNNDGLFWESATSLWKNKSIATILGGTPVTGSGTLYALTKWGFTSGTIINSNLYDTGSVIYNNNATAGAFAVQFNGNATSGMSYGLLINAGSDANDIALRIQNVSSTSEYFFVYGDGKVKMNNIPNATTDTDTFLVSDGGYIKYRTGAQLLSDIGGQAALTNPVTGTGTTNYLPKFTGTSTIGNSAITDDGTTVSLLSRALSGTSANFGGLLTINVPTDNTTVAILHSGGGTANRGLKISTFVATNDNAGVTLDAQTSTGVLAFATAGTERMRLNTSGNLGLGVNPSAWGSNSFAFQTQGGAIWSFSSAYMDIWQNSYYNGASSIYQTTAAASFYRQTSGSHEWNTAPSGTAGTAISWTQAMTLNASGNLSIGNTNNTYKLDVTGTGRFTGSVYSEDVNAYLLNQTGNTTDTKIWSIQNLPTSGQFRIRALNDAMTNGINAIVISRTGISSLSLDFTGAATFSSSVTASGSFISNVVNGYALILNRSAVTNYNGISHATAGSAKWFVGMRENLSSNNYIIYNEATGTDTLTLNTSTNAATFSSSAENVITWSRTSSKNWSLSSDSAGGYFKNTTDSVIPIYMTNGGSVGIGTTSPDVALHIYKTPSTNDAAVYNLVLQDPSAVASRIGSGISFGGFYDATNTTLTFANIKGFKENTTSGDYAGALAFTTRVNGGNPTERMRITSDGNVLIGTTTGDGYKLQIVGNSQASSTFGITYSTVAAYSQWVNSSGAFVMGLDGAAGTTERMRITSGGYLKASNNGSYLYSANSFFEVNQSIADWTQVNVNKVASGTPLGIYIGYSSQTPNNTGAPFLNCDDSTGNRLSIRSNGGIANYQANDVNLSDERTKKDIIALESYWDKFKAIDIVKFKYKDQTHDDYNIGVIAQQVEKVAPEFIDVDGWGETPADGVPLKSVYTADLHHATIKVLQEAMAKIEDLQNQLDTLKNK